MIREASFSRQVKAVKENKKTNKKNPDDMLDLETC